MAFIDVMNKLSSDKKNPPAKFTDWKDFWEKRKNVKALKCKVMNCQNAADAGIHVIKTKDAEREYIVPVCEECLKKAEYNPLKVWDKELVPVIE